MGQSTERTDGDRASAPTRMAGNSTTSRIERAPGEQHHEPVDADADAAGRRHAVLERPRNSSSYGCASSSPAARVARLLLEARALLVGVVELGEGVGDLHAAGEGLEALDEARLARWRLANGDSSTG